MLSQNKYFDEIKTYKLVANKSLGQNFLIDQNLASSIVDKLELSKDDVTLEIGAGLGSLSYFLAQKPGQKVLIDIDEKMLAFLRENYKNIQDLQVKRENILKADLEKYTKIIGNLPYYITSGIIEYVLLNAINTKQIIFMCQKEVYPKLADPSSGPLAKFLYYVGSIKKVADAPRNSFVPVPHVDSLVFEIVPNENIKNEENKKLYKMMCQLFLHRRKTILNNLNSIGLNKEKAEELLDKCGIAKNKRPEQLEISDFKNILMLLK